jgi:23S rRNA (cytidine1920-2'-O)/16S rRNA (cytidine1409-2'-O)-methyltransferase
MRLDQHLVAHHTITRNKAQQLIKTGLVTVDAKICNKSSFIVSDGMIVAITPDRRVEWVSRSAEKLAGFMEQWWMVNGEVSSVSGFCHPSRVLGRDLDSGFLDKPGMTEHWKIRVQWTNCLDVGASTGGFTQVLLQYGAAHVDAVDVGTDQLHPQIRSDSRVTSYEQMDIRDFMQKRMFEVSNVWGFESSSLVPQDLQSWRSRITNPRQQQISEDQSSVSLFARQLPGSCPGQALFQGAPKYDLIVCDASFISLTQILDALLWLASADTDIILLYKPQFEVGKANLRKTGVPKDEKCIAVAMELFEALIKERDCSILGKEKSCLIGEAGNQEWVYRIRRA